MHRRARHLNHGSAGAVLALDSRFITGLSDGDPVSTWTDRSASANNATQTGTARPTFETAEQGGQPVLRFDGTNDFLVCNSYASLSASTIIGAGKSNITTGNDRNMFYFGNANVFSPNFNWVGIGKNYSSAKWISGNYNNPNDGSVVSSAAFTTNAAVASGITNDSGTNRLFVNGDAEGTKASVTININTSARPTIGRRGAESSADVWFWNGDIYCVNLIPSAVSSSLRRRLEHAVAFSFKISCS